MTALDLARARIAQLEREQAQQIETTTTMRQTVQTTTTPDFGDGR